MRMTREILGTHSDEPFGLVVHSACMRYMYGVVVIHVQFHDEILKNHCLIRSMLKCIACTSASRDRRHDATNFTRPPCLRHLERPEMRRRDGDVAKHGHCALAMLLNQSRSRGTITEIPPAKHSASLASSLAPDF
jgi:hypothetical protein